MSDLTIQSYVQRDGGGPTGPCIWCGKQTQVWSVPRFRPALGRVPLHLFCGAFMQDAYRAYQAGGLEAVDPADLPNMLRIAQLGSGE